MPFDHGVELIAVMFVLLILALATLPMWPYSTNWTYFPAGGCGLAVTVIVLLGPRRPHLQTALRSLAEGQPLPQVASERRGPVHPASTSFVGSRFVFRDNSPQWWCSAGA